MLLHKTLKQLLEDRGETVTSLARRSQVPRTTIMGWLSPSSNSPSVNLAQLTRIADALNVSLDFLITGKKEETDLDKLLDKVSIHVGLYEVSIKKVNKK